MRSALSAVTEEKTDKETSCKRFNKLIEFAALLADLYFAFHEIPLKKSLSKAWKGLYFF